MLEIILDTETTGLDPISGDRLVEIGCIEMVDRVATGRTFHSYFNPGRDMPAVAEQVHGLSIEFLADKPRFHEKAAELLDFLGDAPLIAHNASFDIGFINAELRFCGRGPLKLGRVIDTIALARARHPGAKLSLDALCERYEIDRSHRTKHGALLDAELLAQIYVKLLTPLRSASIDSREIDDTIDRIEVSIGQLLQFRDLLKEQRNQAEHAGIGHNRPPRDLQLEYDRIVSDGIIASIAVTKELSEPRPRKEILAICLGVLKRLFTLLKIIAGWVAGKGDKFVDAAAESTGKVAGPALLILLAGSLSSEFLEIIKILKTTISE